MSQDSGHRMVEAVLDDLTLTQKLAVVHGVLSSICLHVPTASRLGGIAGVALMKSFEALGLEPTEADTAAAEAAVQTILDVVRIVAEMEADMDEAVES